MDASVTTGFDQSRRRKSLVAIILSSLGVGTAYGMGYPLTALVLEQRGEPSWVIGLAGAAPSLAILALLPILPKAVARIDPVLAILAGCTLTVAGYAALYFLDNTVAWIAIRFLMGAAMALPWIVGETWINMMATDANRTRVMAFYATAIFTGFAAGPLILEAVGTSDHLPFLAGAMGAVLASIPIAIARKLAPDLAHEPPTGLWGGLRMTPVAMVGGFLGGYLETTQFSLLPNVAIAAGMDEAEALRLLTTLLVGGVAPQFVLGWLGDKTSRKGMLIVLGFIYVGLMMFLPEALKSPLLAYATLFVIGAIVIGFYTLGLAILGEEVQSRHLATANAAFILMYTIGSILGPVIAGVAMTHAPVAGFVVSTASAAAILTLATLAAWRVRSHANRS